MTNKTKRDLAIRENTGKSIPEKYKGTCAPFPNEAYHNDNDILKLIAWVIAMAACIAMVIAIA